MNKLYPILSGILFILLLVGIAGAVYPDNITMISSKEWPVANGADTSQISVVASNLSSGLIPGLSVEYSLNRTDLGTIYPSVTTTGSDGLATSIFQSSTKSGTVLITANIYYKFNQSDSNEPLKNITRSIVQKIDHDTPFNLYKLAPDINGSEVNVGSTVQIVYQMKDYWGNNIDNRKQPITPNETIKFEIDNKPTAYFNGTWNGTPYEGTTVTLPVNDTGYIVVNFTTDIIPGINTVHVIPQSSIPDSSIDIRGVAEGEPYSITQYVYTNQNTIPITITPGNPPTLPADGISEFTFLYNIQDQYGNGIVGTPVVINVSLSGNITKMTDNYGNVIVYIGPTETIGQVNISAFTTNTSVKIVNQTVSFVSTTPVDMLLTADPQSMPSRDVQSTFTSNIIAKVVDDSGNPVGGQLVNFSLSGVSYDGTYRINSTPKLETYSAITDSYDGEAVVLFDPGAFTLNTTDPLYTNKATGRCYVNAEWTNPNGTPTNRSVTLSWKNYPYLSVYTSVQPQLVNVSDTVDVTLILKGDGYALQPPPVDVVLVTDLSGSMTETLPGSSQTKIQGAQAALKTFVANTNSQIYTGLATFSHSSPSYSAAAEALYTIQSKNGSAKPFNPYGSVFDRASAEPKNDQPQADAKINLNFTQVNTTLNTTISGFSASGSTDIASGINAAIQMFNTKGTAGHKKVIVIMTDGIANYAPITPDNLSAYRPSDYDSHSDSSAIAKAAAVAASVKAQSQGATVYTIGFGSDADTTTLTSMATSPSYYYYAPNNTVLNNVYKQIVGQIITEASVNTEMDINMGTVVVNNITQNNNDTNQILNYEYVPGISTLINRFWFTNNTQISVSNPNPNQNATYWNINRTLAFDVGTMHLGEEYKAIYRLQVLHDGNINIFGPGSNISFVGASSMPIPDTYITASYDLTKLGTNTTVEILVTNFTVADDDSGRHFASFNQTIERGNPNAVPSPKIDYIVEMNVGGSWVQIGTVSLTDIETEPINFELLGFIPPGAQLRLITSTEYSSASPEAGQQWVTPPPAYTIYGKTHLILT